MLGWTDDSLPELPMRVHSHCMVFRNQETLIVIGGGNPGIIYTKRLSKEQKERKTERQKDRETEKQRFRKKE